MIATKEPVYQYYERDGDPIRTAVELHGHRRFLRGRYGNDKLLIDFTLKPDILGEGEYYRRERWTTSSEADIIGEGYKLTDGLVTGFAWRRIGVYCRIHNDRWFDVGAHEGEKDADGYPLYSLDTATTLCDFLENNAEKQFIRSLGRGIPRLSDGMVKILGIAAVGVLGVVAASLMGMLRYGTETDERYRDRPVDEFQRRTAGNNQQHHRPRTDHVHTHVHGEQAPRIQIYGSIGGHDAAHDDRMEGTRTRRHTRRSDIRQGNRLVHGN